jgi:hypothetical protein
MSTIPNYGTPAPTQADPRGTRVPNPTLWAAGLTLGTGLILIVLAGVFMIGNLLLIRPEIFDVVIQQNWDRDAQLAFMIIGFAMAIISFVSGMIVMLIGLIRLSRVIQTRP